MSRFVVVFPTSIYRWKEEIRIEKIKVGFFVKYHLSHPQVDQRKRQNLKKEEAISLPWSSSTLRLQSVPSSHIYFYDSVLCSCIICLYSSFTRFYLIKCQRNSHHLLSTVSWCFRNSFASLSFPYLLIKLAPPHGRHHQQFLIYPINLGSVKRVEHNEVWKVFFMHGTCWWLTYGREEMTSFLTFIEFLGICS